MGLKSAFFVVGQLGKGGLEQQLYYLIETLIRNDIKVSCLVWNYDKEDYYVHDFHRLLGDGLFKLHPGTNKLRKVYLLRKSINLSDPDIVVSFSAFTNALSFAACIGLKSIAIGSLRSSANYYLAKYPIRSFVNLCLPPRILVNSKKSILELKEIFFLKWFTSLSFLPNVIDQSRFSGHDVDSQRFTSISVGNMREVKRLDLMVSVFKYLKDNGLDNIRHYHVGGGKEYDKVSRLILEAGLEQVVHLLGTRSDVIDLLEKSNLFLHFSEYEGSPNVIMEAISAGLPVITTNCGDASEYVKHNENGFIVDPFNTEVFAKHYSLLYRNSAIRSRMGATSFEKSRNLAYSGLYEIFMSSLQELGIKTN